MGKFKSRRAVGLYIQLQALQIAERHAQEVRLAGQYQKLMQRIAEIPIRSIRPGGCFTALFLRVESRVLQLIQIGKQGKTVKSPLTIKLL